MDEIMMPTDEPKPRAKAWSRIRADRDTAQAEVRRLQAAHQEMTEQRDRLAYELTVIENALSRIEVPHQLGTTSATDRIAWLRRKVVDQATEIARLQERAAPWWARLLARVKP